MTPKTRSILRRASRHCPPVLQREIDGILGQVPQETLTPDDLWACLVEAVLANDKDDAVHYLERYYHSTLDPQP